MADNRTVTGPVALIKVNGVTIGKIKNIRASESYSRAEVRGLGNLQAQELPILAHSGTFSVDSFLINIKGDGIKSLINRDVTSPEQFINSLLLQDQAGVDIYIYKKIPKTIDSSSKLVTEVGEEPVAILRKCFLDNFSMDISEGQIGNHSQSGKFLEPITFIGLPS